MAGRRPAIVTTSWDDGHPLDLRVAELLAKYGMRGTFYIPLVYKTFQRLGTSEMRQLEAAGMEVGSHTVTHPRMTRISDREARKELEESRDKLEQILGNPVRSFCFPEGKFSKRHLPLIRKAGYALARTTVGFRTELDFDPYLMPVTVQFWPHSRQILLRHSLCEGNVSGLANWIRRWRGASNLAELTHRVLDDIEEFGGVLHFWGHSWELEKAGLWQAFEETLAACAQRVSLQYMTNIGVLAACGAARSITAEVPAHA